jgi:hypothetical protein
MGCINITHWAFRFSYNFQPHYGSEAYLASSEMSARDLPGGKARPAREVVNLTAIYEQIV